MYLLALSSAVLLFTPDNHFIVIKPYLARSLTKKLISLAGLAEAAEKNPSLQTPADEYFKHPLSKKKENQYE
jgi:hypothetical protein